MRKEDAELSYKSACCCEDNLANTQEWTNRFIITKGNNDLEDIVGSQR